MADMAANEGGTTLAKYYFTALGRERYSMYKTNNNPEILIEYFKMPDFSAHGIGDVYEDGSINTNDLTQLMQYAYGRVEPGDEATFKRADINGDGEITLRDLHLLFLYINERLY